MTKQNKALENTIDIYKSIGVGFDWETGEYMYGFSDFLRDYEGIDRNASLKLRMNSYGGSVLEGISMFNVLKAHQGHTSAEIVGYAMSISSIIPLACDKVTMASNAWLLIHEARISDLYGDYLSEDLKALADNIESINEQMASIYSEKTGTPKEEVRELMRQEKYINAEEAFALGLVDEITEGVNIAAKVDLSKSGLKNIPKALQKQIVNSNKQIQSRMEMKKIIAAFGVTEADIKAGDYSKISNVISAVGDIAQIKAKNEALAAENIELRNSLKQIEENQDAVATAVKSFEASIKSTITAAIDLEAESPSPLAAEVKAMKGEISEASKQIADIIARGDGSSAFTGDGGKLKDVESWYDNHKTNFTLQPRN